MVLFLPPQVFFILSVTRIWYLLTCRDVFLIFAQIFASWPLGLSSDMYPLSFSVNTFFSSTLLGSVLTAWYYPFLHLLNQQSSIYLRMVRRGLFAQSSGLRIMALHMNFHH